MGELKNEIEEVLFISIKKLPIHGWATFLPAHLPALRIRSAALTGQSI
jgi:hypothetical protein